MVVQYKGGPEYQCNFLRQQYLTPVCQRIASQPIDDFVVQAFFQALSPVALEVYEQALKSQAETAQQVQRAQQQQLERLQYQAALAQHQYNQVDPDNRLVAAELERRWEIALEALEEAEQRFQRQEQQVTSQPLLPPELKAAFAQIGQKLPQIWNQETLLPTPKKKALLRCLIDKVVIHHLAPDKIQTRIIWKGGEITSAVIPVTVGAFRRLSSADVMEAIILELSQQGQSDEEIAQHLTRLGYTSPRHLQGVLPNTVKLVRLKHHVFLKRSQSHPRHIAGCLTIPQIARQIDVTAHWIYHLIRKGTIIIERDEQTGLYLFPDQPETLALFQQLKAGTVNNLRF